VLDVPINDRPVGHDRCAELGHDDVDEHLGWHFALEMRGQVGLEGLGEVTDLSERDTRG
jgi:hypothetical protein